MSQDKRRITRDRLVKQLHRLKKILSLPRRAYFAFVDKFFGTEIQIVCSDIRSGSFLDRTLFLWRWLGSKAIGDRLGNLALNSENVGQISLIFLCPNVDVIVGID